MHQLLDRRQHPELDDQLRAHAIGCLACRRLLDGQERLLVGLDLLQVETTPPEVSIERIKAHSLPPTSQRSRGWTVAAALAASVLVVTTVWIGQDRLRRPTADETNLAGAESQLTTSDVETDPIAANASPSVAQLPAAEATGEAADEVDAETRFYLQQLANSLPVDRLPKVGSLAPIDNEAVPKGFRPLTSSFNTAFDVLRRTLPGRRDAENAPQAFADFDQNATV